MAAAPSTAVSSLAFILGYGVFCASYIALTVNWKQRSLLLWILPVLGGGLALGRVRGETLNLLLFGFGGCITALAFCLFFPRGKRKEANRRIAAGENVPEKEYEPPQWVVWTSVGGILAWIVFTFIIFRS
ncbi:MULTISPECIES: hypothetical protein [unclassified Streptomyces]|uniref:hypothetical protein n=1 Tax=unclassified Streptomyces TaxID=2593676 RepID=UPI0022503CE7|nr:MULTISPECIES: hypothetical protein [unclassified Streptomyces]MCX4795250.1 hypothetical protein [Streptomyces sp. NBC_01242]WSJ36562.1 hypothetical protein OG772_11300 [Streptomyces sp. NBC_01321]WSP62980.1 hypothetical protein OG466_14595 [Streptomyces sp. NBC_01240]WSU22088.1 hypothetical protein OG508_14680 [Streptomyces sp. NBC_01108]